MRRSAVKIIKISADILINAENICFIQPAEGAPNDVNALDIVFPGDTRLTIRGDQTKELLGNLAG